MLRFPIFVGSPSSSIKPMGCDLIVLRYRTWTAFFVDGGKQEFSVGDVDPSSLALPKYPEGRREGSSMHTLAILYRYQSRALSRHRVYFHVQEIGMAPSRG
jgi:hypothetical protein